MISTFQEWRAMGGRAIAATTRNVALWNADGGDRASST